MRGGCGASGAGVGLRLSGVSIATTLPKFSLLYFSEPSTSISSSLRAVTVPFSSVMMARSPFTVYLVRAKMSEPSLSLMT